jgi:adenine-specific DNA-methyltransferase
MHEEVTLGQSRLIHGRAEDVLPTLEAASVQLILVDPPYMGVKAEAWDRQWQDRTAYLAWLHRLAQEWRRILTPNGSLYCFASPQMAAHVEVVLEKTFHIVNHIVWRKHDGSGAGTGGHSKVCKEELMRYFPQSERIIFAEPYASDEYALGESGYQAAESALKISLFSQPILEAMEGTHTTAKQVTEAIGAYGKVNHGGAVSNWVQGHNIPTKAQYEAMRIFFNTRNCRADYLRQEYEDLRKEYEDLRKEYEDLRKEYEDLRRPFRLSAHMPYTDVWDFATVPAAPGKHPCEKPLPLLRHMIEVSSRPGDRVLDCCAGSFSTLEAAKQCGRQGIGIEQEAHWWQIGQRRLSQEALFSALPMRTAMPPQQLTLM